MTDYPEMLALRPPKEIADILRSIGDDETANLFDPPSPRGAGQGPMDFFFKEKWHCANHLFGFIGPASTGTRLPIVSAVGIEPDSALVGQAIKITLNRFHVAKYPGSGARKILLEFTGRNQAGAEKEDIKFTTTCDLYAQDATGGGRPVFTGVGVPADGLAFEVRTVVLTNEGDELIIDVLQSSLFAKGLTLLGTAQPALPLLTNMGAGVVKHLIKRNKDVVPQHFTLGLDFSRSGTSAQLRMGSYVAAQAKANGEFDWAEWQYDQDSMSIVHAVTREAFPYNYMIFGVSPCSESVPKSGERKEKSVEAKLAADKSMSEKAAPASRGRGRGKSQA